MANSSSLADRLASEAPAPTWMAALEGQGGFREWPPAAEETIAQASDAAEDEILAPSLDALLEEARRKGFEEGREAARIEWEAHLDAAGRLRAALEQLDEATRRALGESLRSCVAELCAQIVEPCQIDEQAIERRCTALIEAIGELPEHCTLHLHPEDVPLLDPHWLGRCQVKTDGSLARGSLRLEGEDMIVRDGPEEWRRAIFEALHG